MTKRAARLPDHSGEQRRIIDQRGPNIALLYIHIYIAGSWSADGVNYDGVARYLAIDHTSSAA